MSEIVSDWGGAQWVLFTILVFGSLLPVIGRFLPEHKSQKQRENAAEFWSEYLGRQLAIIGLVALLYWGEFW